MGVWSNNQESRGNRKEESPHLSLLLPAEQDDSAGESDEGRRPVTDLSYCFLQTVYSSEGEKFYNFFGREHRVF